MGLLPNSVFLKVLALDSYISLKSEFLRNVNSQTLT